MNQKENYRIFFGCQHKNSLSLDNPRRRQLLEWLNRYASALGGKALDLGCWNGEFLMMLPPNWEKCGMDLEQHRLLPPEVQFLQANVEEPFPVPNNSFNLVFAGEIIEHVLETGVFLERCFQVLKPTGLLFLTTPNLSCWLNLWRWFGFDQPWCVNSDGGQDGHVRYFAPLTLRKSLLKAGFQILEMVTVGGLDFLNSYSPIAYRLMFKIFPMRGKNLMAVARKPAEQCS